MGLKKLFRRGKELVEQGKGLVEQGREFVEHVSDFKPSKEEEQIKLNKKPLAVPLTGDIEKDIQNRIKYNQEKLKKSGMSAKEIAALYKPAKDPINKHFQLLEEIKELYTVILNLKGINSPEMNRVIELCYEDIAHVPSFKKAWKKQWGRSDYPPSYPSFERLAIIYEKQKDYDAALEVCRLAIDEGFEKGMPSRVARLLNKKSKEQLKLE